MIILAGCFGARKTARPPDERFGHRFEGKSPDGRETIVLTAPDSAASYLVFPAAYDTVHVRAEHPASPSVAGVYVEVLVKGAFPDACTELHSVEQEKSGHLINVELDMRRPRGLLCASVVRPYRFYFILDGVYEAGHYSLRINDRTHPFVIRPFDSG